MNQLLNNDKFILRASHFSKALLNPDIKIPLGVGKANGEIAPKRFNVYRNNVVVSLIEALKAAYPSIASMMGDENFQRIARFYVSAHPPRTAMMQTFGGEFPDFVKNLPPLKNSPFLKDLALAEKAWLAAYHALDAEPLIAKAFEEFTPNETLELIFTPHPASHLIKSKYPLQDLFDYRNEHPKKGVDMSISQHLLITRPHLSVLTTALNNPLYIFFDLILSGETLSVSIGTALEEDSNFDAGQAIALIIQTGAVTAAHTDKSKL